MTEFESMISDGLEEAIDLTGKVSFEIDGNRFSGSLTEFGDEEVVAVLGGIEVKLKASLMCLIGQFGGAVPKKGRLKIGEKVFAIATVSSDSVSVTFSLRDSDQE